MPVSREVAAAEAHPLNDGFGNSLARCRPPSPTGYEAQGGAEQSLPAISAPLLPSGELPTVNQFLCLALEDINWEDCREDLNSRAFEPHAINGLGR